MTGRPQGGQARRPMKTYEIGKAICRWVLAPLLTRMHVEGRDNIPKEGPFFLVPNHQSILDPLMIQAFCSRRVHSMTKSTQFGSPVMYWLLPRIGAFPARRYRTDPQCVRTVLRLLEDGEGVGIYAEGERSWDGRMQPFRRGTIRLILKAGVPIIPVGITGSYDVWPRWSKRPRRASVRIRYGEPIELGRHDDRAERETAVESTTTLLRARIRELMGTAGAAPPAGAPASNPAAASAGMVP